MNMSSPAKIAFLLVALGLAPSVTSLPQLGSARAAGVQVTIDALSSGKVFEGIGALSAGASSRLLMEYPEQQRNEIVDLLFKPHHGASFQHLKVEIGGDVNSTDGIEPSHARTQDEFRSPRREYFERGYEWWLMKEAKRRNPRIFLDALQWGAPGWIGGNTYNRQKFYSQDNADFIVSFIRGMKDYHGLDLGYCGIWNETPHDAAWIKRLRQTLNRAGLNRVSIVASDQTGNRPWEIAKEMLEDKSLNDSIQVIGAHYVHYQSTAEAQKTAKPLWASEDGPWRGDWAGACALAKIFNRNYLQGKTTKTIIWSLVTSYYDILPLPDSGPMKAKEPWSGHYEVQPALWTIAHTTQFAEPGWTYVDSACGLLPGQGSYVTLRSPDSPADYSVIIETVDASLPQKLAFTTTGALSAKPLHVWRSTESNQFVNLPDQEVANGQFTLTFEPRAVYSLTTTTGQQKGRAVSRPHQDFPFPYTDHFDSYKLGTSARYFSDQGGVFEIAARPEGQGQCLQQVLTHNGIDWPFHPTPEPFSIMGSLHWTNYEVSVDARLSSTGYVALYGRVSASLQTADPAKGYWLKVGTDGQWWLNAFKTTLAQGSAAFGANAWHSLRLKFTGPRIDVFIDQALVKTLEDRTFPNGMAGLGSGWNLASFDNFSVQPIAEAASAAANQSRTGDASTGHREFDESGNVPAGWRVQRAGDLGLTLQQTTNGIVLKSLFDLRELHELLASNSLPLFELEVRDPTTHKAQRLTADAGWLRTSLQTNATGLELRWERARDAALSGLTVKAQAIRHANGWDWRLNVGNATTNWSVWLIRFPQVALADLGEGAAVLFPRGPGEVQKDVWRRDFRYQGNYPGGWCAMQFMAAYQSGPHPTGFYLGVHDPWGSTKNLSLESDSTNRVVRLRFEHPAPNMGVVSNQFALSGDAVWQLLRGDWFDAAMIYKDWAQRQARWWPQPRPDGREDSPAWMRHLNAWAMTGGSPSACVSNVAAFRRFLGMPIGFHWYNWHEIPFDNDYPHYFPTKPGFAAGVAELQQAGVYAMPYINGRLWDTHDRGATDFEFTSRALPATTKHEDHSPYIESYGSKETNGQPVQLGVMCPTTRLWQETISNIVGKLLRDEGTKAVYIDQIAAAPPTLCMDTTHSHPLGGGHWWTEGYWQMLSEIRRSRPADTALTTECNGEPFIRWLDGYLTWHWQFDGQVPVFPAVYGGKIQMFGRAYRGGKTKDLALRMKAAQELVFGEQIGWIDPGVIDEKANAAFLRQMIRLRAQFNRYFSAGEMARPPKLSGQIPEVKADWQWSGEWWVTTDAILTGAWTIPAEHRLALFFVNVSDHELIPEFACDGESYGFAPGDSLRVTPFSDTGPQTARTEPSTFRRELKLPAHTGMALEIAQALPSR